MSKEKNLTELGRALHSRFLESDSSETRAQIAEAFLGPLVRTLKRSFYWVSDQHEIEEQAAQSLLNYFKNPTKFDTKLGSLLGYLRMDASRNLKDMRRAQKKVVELSVSSAEHVKDEAAGTCNQDIESSGAEVLAILRRIRKKLTDPIDRQLLTLILDSERSTKAFAAVLGIEHLKREEQKRVVKRNKDRLKKQIKRAAEKHHRWFQSALRKVSAKEEPRSAKKNNYQTRPD